MTISRFSHSVFAGLLLIIATCVFPLFGQQSGNTNAVAPTLVEVPNSRTVNGTGKTDYIPLWLSSSKLGNSVLFQSKSGSLGVGTTTPVATLDVGGTVNASTSYNLSGNAFAFGSYSTQNVFLGFAGNTATTGFGNTASGYQALLSNTTGVTNTASGYQALLGNTAGQQNTGIGSQALLANTTGIQNTALGYGALSANTIGSGNLALGIDEMSANTTGNNNTGIAGGLSSNTSGSDNIAIGAGALSVNVTGDDNTAVGEYTIGGSDAGQYNTAAGFLALYSNPCDASYNTAVGYAAGYTSSSRVQCGQGNHNTFVGANTKLTDLRFNNATAVGANAQVAASNAMVLGSIKGINGATASTNVGIGTTTPASVFTIGKGAGQAIADGWSTYSSRRWKTNIRTLQGSLAKVERLRGVSYDLKDSGKHEVGVIAEEVGAVVPEIVSWDKLGKDAQAVDYGRLTALLIEAMKEQQREFRQEQIELARAVRQIKHQRSLLRTQSAAIFALESKANNNHEGSGKTEDQVATTRTALITVK